MKAETLRVAPSTAMQDWTKFWQAVFRRRVPLGRFHAFEPVERIELVRSGIPADFMSLIAEDMAIPKERLYLTVGLPRATAARKQREKQLLNQDESERVLGVARLIGQVESVVRESGNPQGFNAARWVAAWIERPNAALGGKLPASLMDTAEGREMVFDLVARMQTGAYA